MARFCLVASVFLLTSCATLVGPKAPQTVLFTFKGEPGQITETRYVSTSRTLTYSEGQLLRDKTEGVDFSVQNKFASDAATDKLLKFTLRTVRKDGTVPLHDLSFPELQEEIDYVVNAESAKVLRAGLYPSSSLFFIPTLPMPQRPVEVGDTWSFEHNWISAHDQVPLHLEVIAIFKELIRCSNGQHWCADLELSGQLSLLNPPTVVGGGFESRIRGRVLFDLDHGDVLWSEIHSREEMQTQKERIVVHSCMISELKAAQKLKLDFHCQPNEKTVIARPM